MSELVDNGKAYAAAAAEDLSNSPWYRKVELGVTGLVLGAHELGMEASQAAVGLHALEATNGNPFAGGAAMFASSLAIESVLTVLISDSAERFPAVSKAIADRHYPEEEVVEEVVAEAGQADAPKESHKVRDTMDNAVIALTFGSPGRIIKEKVLDVRRNRSDSMKTGFTTARRLAVFNGIVGGTFGTAAWVAEQTGHDPSGPMEAVAKSPLTYLTIFGIFRGLNYMDRRSKRRAEAAEEVVTAPAVLNPAENIA